MKTLRKLLLLGALVAAQGALAQNIQLHYDLGHSLWPDDLSERPSVTTTAEMFRPDRLGSTFFFIDLDYYTNGVAGAYWEISREFNFLTLSENDGLAAHVEYNGGVGTSKDLLRDTRYQQALLLGPAYNWHSSDFRKTFSLQALYKYFFRGEHAYQRAFSSVQFTAVWGISFAHGACDFSGYCDVWYDRTVNGNWIVQSEPQLWYNLNTLPGLSGFNLSLGGEVEISNNFVFTDLGRNNRLFFIPTLGMKYTF